MAKIKAICPHCQAEGNVDTQFLGKKGRCPKCGQAFVLTAPASVALAGAAPVAAAPAAGVWKPGDLILGLYEVRGILGEGGMGTVYKVHHRNWDLDLAVKRARPAIVERAGGVEDFEREAETWVNLGLYPHTASCYYVRRIDHLPCVFAELVEGGSLRDWITRGKLYEGGPEAALARILDIAIQFAWGLHFAHEQGLVHQDVKPANVLLTADGVAKVTDFGLARAQAAANTSGPLPAGASPLVSVAGMTPAYCSPEQAERRRLTLATDVWSWAVSLLEMFTGEVTWPSGVVAGAALEEFTEADPASAGSIRMPPALLGLLRRCLQLAPEARPGGMHEIADALKDVYRESVGKDYPRMAPAAAQLLADSHNNRAVSLLDLGRRDAAEGQWRQALQAHPGHPEATYNLGVLHWNEGRITDDALVAALQESRASHPQSWVVSYALGLAELARGDGDAARAALAEARQRGGAAEVDAALERAETLAAELPRCVRQWKPSKKRRGRPRQEHKQPITCVAASADRTRVLTGTADFAGNPQSSEHPLYLWHATGGQCLHVLNGHTAGVNSVAISGDGRLAVSGSNDTTVRIWDLAQGKCLHVLQGHTDRVAAVALSADGTRAVSASADGAVRQWSSAGASLATLSGHTGAVNAVALSADGTRIVSGSNDGTVRVWDWRSGACVYTFTAHAPSAVASVALSGDGRLALSADCSGNIQLWETPTGTCRRVLKVKGEAVMHLGTILAVSLSASGDWALIAEGGINADDDDQRVRLWDLRTGACRRTWPGANVSGVHLSADGAAAVFGRHDRTLDVWDVAWFCGSTYQAPAPQVLCRAVRTEQVFDVAGRFQTLLALIVTVRIDAATEIPQI